MYKLCAFGMKKYSINFCKLRIGEAEVPICIKNLTKIVRIGIYQNIIFLLNICFISEYSLLRIDRTGPIEFPMSVWTKMAHPRLGPIF
jgi:hypothetical protein